MCEAPSVGGDGDADLYSADFSRKLMLALAVAQSSCCTGVLFGYSALASALMGKGEYSELCAGGGDAEDGACAEQKLRFSLLYTFASTCLFSSFLVFGLMVDKW
jgi:hypothetical protein